MTTPNMNLDNPIPSSTLGPTWASMLVAVNELIDAHDHATGKGVKITPLGMNITSDLAFGAVGSPNRASNVKSVQLATNAATLVGALDLGALYQVSGDLYFTNLSGTAVKITSGGSLNSAALVSNLYAQSAVSTNVTINPASSYVELRVDTTAVRIVTLPAANAVTAGRFYIIKDVSGSAAGNAISLAADGTDTIDGVASKSLATNYGTWTVVSDGVSRWDYYADSHEVGGIQVTGTPAVGNVLRATTTTAAAWGALDLADTDAVTGILPSANLFQATTATSGAVKLAGDFDSTSTAALPRVSSLTGNAADDTVTVNATVLSFEDTLAGVDILQAVNGAAAGNPFAIQAQSSSIGAGGDMMIASGDAQVSGLDGRVEMRIGGSIGRIAVQGVEVAAGRNVTALALNTTDCSATNVPTGNRVVFIGDAGTAPSTPPTGGAVFYSTGGNPAFFGANATAALEIIGTADAVTAPAAGAAPLPSNPVTYLRVKWNGVILKLAGYSNS